MYGIATVSAAAILLFTGRSGKPCQLLDHETVETRRSRSHYEFRRVRSMTAVSKYRFVVDLAHAGGGCWREEEEEWIPAGSVECKRSKQGSPGRLVRFSNHLIYTRSCPSPAQQDWLPEKTRGHIHTEQTLQISTPLEKRPLCVDFVFFVKPVLNERSRMLRDLQHACSTIFHHNSRATGYIHK